MRKGINGLNGLIREYLQQDPMSKKFIQIIDKGPEMRCIINSWKRGHKPNIPHQWYMWVYRNGENGLVLFDYRKGRGMDGPSELLKDFSGYLQCDGIAF